MTDRPFDVDRDLKEARSMVEALVPYVYETELYGRTGSGFWGGNTMPALTLGALLLRLRRLTALESGMSPTQRDHLSAIVSGHEAVRTQWRQHYVEKLHREGDSRLKAMRTFFEECEDSPRACANNYAPEVLRRSIVQEIARMLVELGEPHDELKKAMRGVDGKLRRFTQPAEFLWEDDLQAIYPQPEFWWLYAAPPRVERERA